MAGERGGPPAADAAGAAPAFSGGALLRGAGLLSATSVMREGEGIGRIAGMPTQPVRGGRFSTDSDYNAAMDLASGTLSLTRSGPRRVPRSAVGVSDPTQRMRDL